MDLIIADSQMQDLDYVIGYTADIEIGKEDNSFDISVPRTAFNDKFKIGNILYIPETEFGGIIGELRTETSTDTIHLCGYTWRGMLSKKIIEPDPGSMEKTVSGDLSDILSQITANQFGALFQVSGTPSGITLSDYKIIGYSTMLEALNLMFESVNAKLKVKYVQQQEKNSYIELSAVPVTDYSNEIEFSSDYQLDFTFHSIKNGVNHLIVINPETQNRLDLYTDSAGNISEDKTYTGINEIEEKLESSESDSEAFRQEGIEHLKEIMNRQSFSMNVESLNLDVDIGDIIGGRDYLTGLSLKKPIISKVLKIEDGQTSLEYEIEGED